MNLHWIMTFGWGLCHLNNYYYCYYCCKEAVILNHLRMYFSFLFVFYLNGTDISSIFLFG